MHGNSVMVCMTFLCLALLFLSLPVVFGHAADGFEHQFAPNQNHTQLLQEFHPIIVEHEPPPDKVEEESIKKKRKKGK